MQIRPLVTNPARFAACALFGFLAFGVAALPAHSGHQHSSAQSGVTAPATPGQAANPTNPTGVFGWE